MTTTLPFNPEREIKKNLRDMYMRTINSNEEHKALLRKKQLLEEQNHLKLVEKRIKEEDEFQKREILRAKERQFSDYKQFCDLHKEAKPWTLKEKLMKNNETLGNKVTKQYMGDLGYSVQETNFFIGNGKYNDPKPIKKLFLDKRRREGLSAEEEKEKKKENQVYYRNILDNQIKDDLGNTRYGASLDYDNVNSNNNNNNSYSNNNLAQSYNNPHTMRINNTMGSNMNINNENININQSQQIPTNSNSNSNMNMNYNNNNNFSNSINNNKISPIENNNNNNNNNINSSNQYQNTHSYSKYSPNKQQQIGSKYDPFYLNKGNLGNTNMKHNPIIYPKNNFNEKRFHQYISFINQDIGGYDPTLKYSEESKNNNFNNNVNNNNNNNSSEPNRNSNNAYKNNIFY